MLRLGFLDELPVEIFVRARFPFQLSHLRRAVHQVEEPDVLVLVCERVRSHELLDLLVGFVLPVVVHIRKFWKLITEYILTRIALKLRETFEVVLKNENNLGHEFVRIQESLLLGMEHLIT